MSSYQRPWWLLVNKPPGLVTTVQEESRPGERTFIIHGEPLVQGLAWLTWGPVSAVLTVLILTVVALAFNVKEQSGIVRGAMVAAFIGLPALVWIGTTLLLSRLSQKHLQAERQADSRKCVIRLCQDEGELRFQPPNDSEEHRLLYGNIQQVKVTRPIGEQVAKNARLTLYTNAGAITLLDETLGTHLQKVDLANEIQQVLQANAAN
jgi:hypothetical protein